LTTYTHHVFNLFGSLKEEMWLCTAQTFKLRFKRLVGHLPKHGEARFAPPKLRRNQVIFLPTERQFFNSLAGRLNWFTCTDEYMLRFKAAFLSNTEATATKLKPKQLRKGRSHETSEILDYPVAAVLGFDLRWSIRAGQL
jgi:hypothetical protein